MSPSPAAKPGGDLTVAARSGRGRGVETTPWPSKRHRPVPNHPFLDGNKRTAVAAADVHLRMHGFELAGDSMEHHRHLITLMERGDLDWRAIVAWSRDNVEES